MPESCSSSFIFYAAPELLAAAPAPASTASDLWALGCLLYECVAGRRPFGGSTKEAVAAAVLRGQPKTLPGTGSGLGSLIARLLDPDPATRATWNEVRAHPVWGDGLRLADAELPEQPALAEYLSSRRRAGRGRRRGDSPGLAAESPARMPSANGSGELLCDEDAGEDCDTTPAHPAADSRHQPRAAGEGHRIDFGGAVSPEGRPGESRSNERAASLRVKDGSASPSLEDLAWHPNDGVMKPIAGNPHIERPPDTSYEMSLLHFTALPAANLAAAPEPQRRALLSALCASMRRPADPAASQATLCYLGSLAQVPALSSALLASDLPNLVLSRLAYSGPAEVRGRLAHTLGMLFRHAAELEDALGEAGTLRTLAHGLRDREAVVRRGCAAALGEMLFYLCCKLGDRPAADPGPWQVDSQVLAALLGALDSGEDDVVRHYAAKTLENVFGQGGEWAKCLATLYAHLFCRPCPSWQGGDSSCAGLPSWSPGRRHPCPWRPAAPR
jgi:serine/threonine-protein kinase ULK4